jgi:hypothetical protein
MHQYGAGVIIFVEGLCSKDANDLLNIFGYSPIQSIEEAEMQERTRNIHENR